MAYTPFSSSTVSFQSDPTKLVATVSVVSHSPQSVATLQGTNPWIVTLGANSGQASVFVINKSESSANSSVITVLKDSSVAALQGTNPWLVNVPTPSYLSYQAAGSVLAVNFPTNQNVSGSVVAYQGTSSWVTKPFVVEDASVFRYEGSVVSTSVTLIAPSVAGKKLYVTDFMVANTGSVATLITFRDGSTSLLGRTVAPPTSGSNKQFAIPLATKANAQDLAFQVGTATSVLYLTVHGYQA